MNKKNFDLLLGSMREGAQILRGERAPSRRFTVDKKEDVQFLAESAYADACRPGNPRDCSVAQIAKLYKGLM